MTEPLITKEMLDGAPTQFAGHYNGLGYRFADFPRLMFIDVFQTIPEKRHERWWFVDDARFADVEAAIAALNAP